MAQFTVTIHYKGQGMRLSTVAYYACFIPSTEDCRETTVALEYLQSGQTIVSLNCSITEIRS